MRKSIQVMKLAGGVGFSAILCTQAMAIEQIYFGGPILTMKDSALFAEAIAVDEGRIIAVGSQEDIEKLAGDKTERVDLQGKTLMPGFIDPHGHMMSAGTAVLKQADLNPPPMGTVTDMAGLIATLKDYAASTPDAAVIRGTRYDDTLIAENRHPTREDLDQVSTEKPVIVTHISGHVTAGNSKALEMAGVTAEMKDPDGGRIARDSKGQPNGVMEGNAGALLRKLIAKDTSEDELAAIKKGSEMWAAAGFTTANDQFGDPAVIDAYKKAIADGDFKVRLTYWPRVNTIEAASKFPTVKSGTDVSEGRNLIHQGPLKLVIDGSPQGYTAHFSQPYMTQRAHDHGDYKGFSYWDDRKAFFSFVKRLHRDGWQMTTHANGDQGIQDILDAYSAAQSAYPRDGARHTIQHAQFTRPDQLDQMAALNVNPSFFIGHTFYWGDRHKNVFFGKSRAEHISPMKGALERKLIPTTHTDTWVTPIDGIQMIWSSVNRVSTGGDTIGEGQRVDPLDAMKAITVNAAWQYFQEDIKGTIEPGKLADFVVLSDNPLSVGHLDPMKIKDIKILKTIVGGKTVFEGETKSIVANHFPN